MESVQVFNTELSSLYEMKPPISKAKMSQVTKAALKGIKMYKHVVQSVEKFIAKCKPEYKLPGLYVIDSIVRQSRHTYTADKDVFGPRFMRNFKQTFHCLFTTCPPTDKPKIVRVLNLWQHNGVFPAEAIQPLLDMANPNAPACLPESSDSPTDAAGSSVAFRHRLRKLKTEMSRREERKRRSGEGSKNGSQDRKSGAFDYEDDDDNVGSGDLPAGFDDSDGDERAGETPTEAEPLVSETVSSFLQQQNQQEIQNHSDIAKTISQNLLMHPEIFKKLSQIPFSQPSALPGTSSSSTINTSNVAFYDEQPLVQYPSTAAVNAVYPQDVDVSQEQPRYSSDSRDRERDYRRRQSSRSPSPSRRSRYSSRSDRRRSRSRDRSGKDRSRRSRRSPDDYDRRRDEDREVSPRSLERERERQKRKMGIPSPKPACFSICSKTIFLGHLPKLVSEKDITEMLEDFGEISSIELIPPRGCGFVCMKTREDAYKIMSSSSKNFRLSGSYLKTAWAPGKGMKGKDFKDYWDVDQGCSFLPYSLLTDSTDFDDLEEGGIIDEDSLPPPAQEMRRIQKEQKLIIQSQLQQQRLEAEKRKESERTSSPNNQDEKKPLLSIIPSSIPPPIQGPPLPIVPPPIPMPMNFSIPPPGMSIPPPNLSIPPPSLPMPLHPILPSPGSQGNLMPPQLPHQSLFNTPGIMDTIKQLTANMLPLSQSHPQGNQLPNHHPNALLNTPPVSLHQPIFNRPPPPMNIQQSPHIPRNQRPLKKSLTGSNAQPLGTPFRGSFNAPPSGLLNPSLLGSRGPLLPTGPPPFLEPPVPLFPHAPVRVVQANPISDRWANLFGDNNNFGNRNNRDNRSGGPDRSRQSSQRQGPYVRNQASNGYLNHNEDTDNEPSSSRQQMEISMNEHKNEFLSQDDHRSPVFGEEHQEHASDSVSN